MTQNERRVKTIKQLMSMKRVLYKDGILLTTGEIHLFYNTINGRIWRITQDDMGDWKPWGKELGRLKRGYLGFQFPGSGGLNVYNHIVAGVALGFYDNVDIEKVEINHKNFDRSDNRRCNIEPCTRIENKCHQRFREICRQLGIWVEGISIEAKAAVYILKKSKGYTHLIKDEFNQYINEQTVNY